MGSADDGGGTLRNRAVSEATPPGLPPIKPPEVVTEHPVPGYVFSKTADPKSTTPVKVGETITYTLTGTNTGATVLDPVEVNDDLSEVLKAGHRAKDLVKQILKFSRQEQEDRRPVFLHQVAFDPGAAFDQRIQQPVGADVLAFVQQQPLVSVKHAERQGHTNLDEVGHLADGHAFVRRVHVAV